ncbi:hypothetical protein NLU13_3321 [Sarocladium strictum]|uniref:Uncharacterized protein n=1 Tax=Sarocladium strictum TaxID=5046 RepID=A0AA39LA70_SARSR|nr:hypothetical protein NLU13_3321 [Sarocladium strictum]
MGLDYIGALLIVPGICLTLVGIINTTVSDYGHILMVQLVSQIPPSTNREGCYDHWFACQWLQLHYRRPLRSCFSNLLGHWKWTLTDSWIGLSIFGGLLALVRPNGKGMMIAFCFLEQMFFGWVEYESIAFTRLGINQIDLGISGGLAGVAHYAGGSLAQAIYTNILTNTQSERAAKIVPSAAIRLDLGSEETHELFTSISTVASVVIARTP